MLLFREALLTVKWIIPNESSRGLIGHTYRLLRSKKNSCCIPIFAGYYVVDDAINPLMPGGKKKVTHT